MTGTVRLRHLAEVNPATTEFDRLHDDAEVVFMPLETVWANGNADFTRRRPKAEVSIGYTRFRNGDILVPKVTPTFQAGRVAIADVVTTAGAGTTELHVLRARVGVDPRYVGYVCRSGPFLTEGVAAFQGVAGLQRVPEEFVKSFPVADLPLDEQRRIADFLDAETSRIDRLIHAQRHCAALLTERRAAAVYSLVTGSSAPTRRPSGLAWTEMLPSDWETVNLSLIAKMGSGHTPSRNRADWWIDTEIPWITTGEVSQVRDDRREVITETRERISKIGLANSAAEIHPAGTVVLSRTASAGFSAVMGLDMATSQDFVTWTCGPRIDPFYLLWCLRAMRPDLLGRLAMGSTHKTIYVPDLQALRVPVPPIEVQRTIVDEIRASNARHDRLSDAIARQLVLLAERRQALITAAVTGQLGVTNSGLATADLG